MAGTLESNASIYVKKSYSYVPPSPPSDLIDCSNYVLDFVSRKFLHIGIDPASNFDVVIHIITASRHVTISPDLLKRIFALMGNILSFVLDSPQKSEKITFLETDTTLISNMVYRGENSMVIKSQNREECRVLLNRSDLIKLQYLEWCISETIARKFSLVRPMVIEQYNHMKNIITKESPPQADLMRLEYFVKNITDIYMLEQMPKADQSYVSQIKLFATEQLVESSLMELNGQKSELQPSDDEYERAHMHPSSPSSDEMLIRYNTPPSSMAIDENDGPTVFNAYSPVKSRDDYPIQARRWASKRKLFSDLMLDE